MSGAGVSPLSHSGPAPGSVMEPRTSRYPFITATGFLFVGLSAVPFPNSIRLALALLGVGQFLVGMVGWLFLEKLERYAPGSDQPGFEDGGQSPSPTDPRDGHSGTAPLRSPRIAWRPLKERPRRISSTPIPAIRRPVRRIGGPVGSRSRRPSEVGKSPLRP